MKSQLSEKDKKLIEKYGDLKNDNFDKGVQKILAKKPIKTTNSKGKKKP